MLRPLRESLIDDFSNQAGDLRYLRIEEWMKKNSSSDTKYIINDDYTIDVNNTFIYTGHGNFPDYIQFKRCSGPFEIVNCGMTSLKGCPQWVGGYFNCSDNKLKTLEGGPKYTESYLCDACGLISLKGAPIEITGDFHATDNRLRSLKYCPTSKCHYISYYFSHNNITSLKDCPDIHHVNYFFDYNNLKSLKYCPKNPSVLDVSNNELTSLEGCASQLRSLYCNNNNITEIGTELNIDTYFYCQHNKLQLISPYIMHPIAYVNVSYNYLSVQEINDVDKKATISFMGSPQNK